VTVSVSEIAQQRTVRLIPTAYYKAPVLRALVDSDAELEILAKLEGETCRRLTASAPPADLDLSSWGHTYISAAFAYRRTGGNRFNDDTRGAWYAGFDDRTALEEVAFHKTRELGFIDYFFDEVQYRAIHASFIGRFHDLRNATPSPVCLDPDVSIGYPAGQKLANELMAQRSRGLIYPSVRHHGGICIVAFQPNAVQDPAPGACWKLTWTGTPSWTATAV
jgi:hypothetical protein